MRGAKEGRREWDNVRPGRQVAVLRTRGVEDLQAGRGNDKVGTVRRSFCQGSIGNGRERYKSRSRKPVRWFPRSRWLVLGQ